MLIEFIYINFSERADFHGRKKAGRHRRTRSKPPGRIRPGPSRRAVSYTHLELSGKQSVPADAAITAGGSEALHALIYCDANRDGKIGMADIILTILSLIHILNRVLVKAVIDSSFVAFTEINVTHAVVNAELECGIGEVILTVGGKYNPSMGTCGILSADYRTLYPEMCIRDRFSRRKIPAEGRKRQKKSYRAGRDVYKRQADQR